MVNYEKLGLFYLGKAVDPKTQAVTPEYVLYDSKDLVTHAVCVGMTGSGKTGLCIGLLEEAAIDKIPAIIVDPKGDLTNLMLLFPTSSRRISAPGSTPTRPRKRASPRTTMPASRPTSGKKG